MNTKGILRPDELPFECPLDLEIAINNLIDTWVCEYYLYGGWRKDSCDQ